MDFLILVGQRKQRYEGEYLPEALEVIDANGNNENPEFLINKRDEYERSKEFDSLAVVHVRVPGASITEALYPTSKAIGGLVV